MSETVTDFQIPADELARRAALLPHLRAEPFELPFANGPRMRALTAADVLALKPCWERRDDTRRGLIVKLWAEHSGGESLTALDVARAWLAKPELQTIVPGDDLVWLLTRDGWYAEPRVVLGWLAADWAFPAVEFFERRRPGDYRPRRALEAARACALTRATQTEHLDSTRLARRAARAAADDARSARWSEWERLWTIRCEKQSEADKAAARAREARRRAGDLRAHGDPQAEAAAAAAAEAAAAAAAEAEAAEAAAEAAAANQAGHRRGSPGWLRVFWDAFYAARRDARGPSRVAARLSQVRRLVAVLSNGAES